MRNFNPLIVAVLLFCAMGMWGCNQQKTGVISAKIRDLETRYTKLEEDYRTLQVMGEQTRKRLTQAEAQRAALEKDKTDLSRQLNTVTGDHERLQKQLSQRTVERDFAQTNLQQFSKDLQALAGRVEAALNSPPQGPSATIIPASRRTE